MVTDTYLMCWLERLPLVGVRRASVPLGTYSFLELEVLGPQLPTMSVSHIANWWGGAISKLQSPHRATYAPSCSGDIPGATSLWMRVNGPAHRDPLSIWSGPGWGWKAASEHIRVADNARSWRGLCVGRAYASSHHLARLPQFRLSDIEGYTSLRNWTSIHIRS